MQYLKGAPAHLNALAEYLREELSSPEAWVEVQASDNGYVIGIALDVTLEETGDAESGPHMSMSVKRWVEVTPTYNLLVYDVSDVTQEDWETMAGPWDLPQPIRLTMPEMHVEGVEEVAKYIVRLFKALGVEQKEAHVDTKDNKKGHHPDSSENAEGDRDA